MNLTTAIQEYVVEAIKNWIVERLGDNLRQAALPGITGVLAESVHVRLTGQRMEVYVDGPAESYAYEWEFGKTADSNATFTHTYTKRTQSGQLQRIRRTYTNGMKPQMVPKKMAGGGNAWRTYPVSDRPGTGKFRQAFRNTMEELRIEIPRILPREIKVTSLD